jgi:hypothetical protein
MDIRVLRFKTEYTAAGIGTDWVEYTSQDAVNESGTPTHTTWELVRRLQPPENTIRNDDGGLKMAAMRSTWAQIEPHYTAWKEGNELPESGTPLAEWPAMSKSQVEEMKYFGFFTVEHIANARDDLLHKFPGLLSLKQRATAFLELASGSAPIERLQSELEKERRANQALQAQMADLAARMAKMETAKEKA